MIDWSRGIVAKYYATIVDPITWRDISEINVMSGSIKYSNSGDRISADINCRAFDHDNENWIRIYLGARQGNNGERVPIFTGIASIPDTTYHGRTEENKLQCYSSLSLADKVYLPLGWYANKGYDGGKLIQELLSKVITAPIVVEEGSPVIDQNVISENGETVLSMVDKILNIIGWRIIVDGDGTIEVKSPPSYVQAAFDYRNNDIFEMDVTVSNNLYDIPNVYRAVGSGISSTAKDEDPNSPFSIINRGREIWVSEDNVVLSNNEKIGDYALRKLKESQKIYKTLDYTRRFDPDVHISDVVQINYLEQGISGLFTIESQTLNIGYGGKVSEQAKSI